MESGKGSINGSAKGTVRAVRCALLGSGLLGIAAIAPLACADTFKIVDEKGKVQYTDRVPAESVNRGLVELNKQGMQKKVVEATLTREQRLAKEEKDEQEKAVAEAEKRAAQLRRNKENALLSSYTSENDIDLAKRRNLALVGASILSAEARIKALQRRSTVLDQEKQFYEKKPVPEKLKREMAMIGAEIPKQYEVIVQRNKDAEAVIAKYEDQKRQFRELKARIASETLAAKQR